MPARLLLRGQWRARRRRQLWVGASLAVGFVALFAASMLLDGAQHAVLQPLHDTLSGDVRITQGSGDIAGGTRWADVRPLQDKIGMIPGASSSPRWEASQVTARQDRLENWTGGLLIGIEPSMQAEQDPLRPYLSWGNLLPTTSTEDPATHHVYVPLLVGEAAARRLDLHPGPGGRVNFSEVLTVSSGRLAGAGRQPVYSEAVVVGIFASGLDSLDRFAVFAPIEDVRFLVGDREGDPSANALIVHGASLTQIEALGVPGIYAEDAHGVAGQTIGIVLLTVDVAATLALVILIGVLALLVVREVGLQVTRDAPAVAALRAIGVPMRSILGSYVGLSAATVGAAALVAAAIAVGLALFAPPVHVSGRGLTLAVTWRLQWTQVAVLVASAVVVAALGAAVAARRLAKGSVAEALRPA